MLPTTQPESIEQFSIRLAETWQIGRSKVDDGVIIIVAKEDRSTRIEVGYGLEGAIPDAIAKRIIAEEMTPHFSRGDFAGGLNAAIDRLEKLIAGEELPAPTEDSANRFDSPLIFLVLLAASLARALFGMVGSIGISLVAAAITWFTFGSIVAAIGVGLFTFLISLIRFSPGSGGGRGGGGGIFRRRILGWRGSFWRRRCLRQMVKPAPRRHSGRTNPPIQLPYLHRRFEPD